MEPLLVKMARDFTDAKDLSDRLQDLYRVRHACTCTRLWTRTETVENTGTTPLQADRHTRMH